MILQKIKNLICGKNIISHFCLHDSGKINLNPNIKKYSWAWNRRNIFNTEQNIINPLNFHRIPTHYFPRKVLTWNIQELFLFSNEQKLNNIIRYLSDSNVDAIFLQEAFEPDSIRAIINNHNIESKFPYFLTGDMHSNFLIGENSGLLILSKFPISFQKFIPFKNTVFCDKFSTKGILYCKIGDINFATTHLQSENNKIAEEQLKLMVKYAPHDNNLISLGDFNINNANSILNIEKNNYSITHSLGILDYILPLSSAITVNINVDPINITNISDHFPVVGNILFR